MFVEAWSEKEEEDAMVNLKNVSYVISRSKGYSLHMNNGEEIWINEDSGSYKLTKDFIGDND